MEKNLKIAFNAIDALVEDVKAFVKENGGFIKTEDDGYSDTIYAYVIDWDNDDVHEDVVYAIKVEDDELYVATCGKNMGVIATNVDDVPEDEWYPVGTGGDSVLLAQTILSIAESIEQYVD